VSDFVEECRREWKRLRVPSGPAEEMADDLAADLREAEAEGAFPEEVLGNGADDPRAFAAAWARERGLIQPHWSDRLRSRGVLLAAGVLLALLALGAALASVFLSSGDGRTDVVTYSPAPSTEPIRGQITGTSIGGARLLPSGARLLSGTRLRYMVDRQPRSISTTVVNSGLVRVSRVTLVIEVDGKRISRTLHDLLPDGRRKVVVPLPEHLPARYTIRVRTLPVPGEGNTANNSSAWKIAVRP
jgi:hypothetical protein